MVELAISKPKIEIKIIKKDIEEVVAIKEEDNNKKSNSKKISNKSLELVIDKREIHALKIEAAFNDSNVKIVHENLDVGDLLFRYRINDMDEYINLILIERKTVSDFVSSIKGDNRYKEQKVRLKAMQKEDKNLKIFYLIEGIFSMQKCDRYFTEIDRKIMFGAYVGTIVRDNVAIIQTKDFSDTIATLLKISKLIIENPESFSSQNMKTQALNSNDTSNDTNNTNNDTNVAMEYMIPVKIKKSENKTVRWCYLAMLQQIQGVSEQVASSIAEKYPNLQSLIEAYKSLESDDKRVKMLEDIALTDRKLTKTGKTRLLGSALASTIWLSLGSPK